jgi:hypothetical protein
LAPLGFLSASDSCLANCTFFLCGPYPMIGWGRGVKMGLFTSTLSGLHQFGYSDYCCQKILPAYPESRSPFRVGLHKLCLFLFSHTTSTAHYLPCWTAVQLFPTWPLMGDIL